MEKEPCGNVEKNMNGETLNSGIPQILIDFESKMSEWCRRHFLWLHTKWVAIA